MMQSSHPSAAAIFMTVLLASVDAAGQVGPKVAADGLTYPPTLPNGEHFVSDTSADFLKPPASIPNDVMVAMTAPTIDFLYLPGQNYPGKPWSNWGDSLAIDGKYYTSIGDHLAIGAKGDGSNGTGTALVFEYDPETRRIRQLVDVSKFLSLPAGHYTPGKIHGRLDRGADGWIYFSTHRGSARATTDQYHYKGDWILRVDPKTGKCETLAHAPVSKHCIPASVLDPKRLIFYGGTAPGTGADDETGVNFFAYDIGKQKVLYAGPDGPSRYLMLATSSGRVYYVPGKGAMIGNLMRYDPEIGGAPKKIDAVLGLRAATQETPQGKIYTVSNGAGGNKAELYMFDTKTEQVEKLGSAAIGAANYITSLDVDPTGRYLYYIPGAHGDSGRDGSPVIQFDTKTRQKKVLAFLHSFYKDKYGAGLVGTFSSAIDPKGDKLYITWNVNRGGKAWDSCALTILHIPESERP